MATNKAGGKVVYSIICHHTQSHSSILEVLDCQQCLFPDNTEIVSAEKWNFFLAGGIQTSREFLRKAQKKVSYCIF